MRCQIIVSSVFVLSVAGFVELGLATGESFPWRVEFVTPRLIGDIDGDGRLDLVGYWATLTPSDFLSIRFGRTDGTFGNPIEETIGANHEPIVADVNADGRTDVLYFSGPKLVARLGSPTGLLAAIESPGIAGNEQARLSADVDGDGNVDVISVQSSSPKYLLHVYLGSGTGSFSQSSSLPIDGTFTAARACDLDGDGDLDLVEPTIASNLFLFINQNGVFQPSIMELPVWYTSLVDVRDRTGDGRADLVVASDTPVPGDPVLLVLLIQSGVSPTLSYQPLPPAVLPFPHLSTFDTTDLDGDGGADLVMLGSADTTTSSDVPRRLATIRSAATSTGFDVVDLKPFVNVTELAVADLDHDGWLDLVGQLLIDRGSVLDFDFVNPADDPTISPAVTDTQFGLVATADFDGDGNIDVVRRGALAGEIAIQRGDGLGGFMSPQSIAIVPGIVQDVHVDQGSGPNIGLIVNSSTQIWRLKNLGGLQFSVSTPVPGLVADSGLVRADLDLDGEIDIAVRASVQIGVHFGTTNGFGSSYSIAPRYALPRSLASGDVTGDGAIDLVTIEVAAGTRVVVYANDGQGLLSYAFDRLVVPGSILFARLAVGDFDVDGDADVLTLYNVISQAIPHPVLDLKHSSGSALIDVEQIEIESLANWVFNSSARDIAVGDWTGDGRVDIALSRSTDSLVVTYLGRADGRFDVGPEFALAANRDLDIADVDSDGRPDFVGSSAAATAVALQHPQGLGVAPYGVGKAGTLGVPSLSAISAPQIDSEFGIRLSQARPATPSILLIGSNALAQPLDLGTLLVAPEFVFALPPTSASGTLELQNDLSGLIGLCGVEIHMQIMLVDPVAAGALHTAQTAGLRVTFGL